MNIKSCDSVLLVEFDRWCPDLSIRLLDENDFPWETVFSKDSSAHIGIKPLRKDAPAKFHELFCYDDRLPIATGHRIKAYITSLEGIDPNWSVTAGINPKSTVDGLAVKCLALDADTPEGLGVKCLALDADTPEGHVSIKAGGLTWGPLPITPLEAPATWPFPARTLLYPDKLLTLTPLVGGHRMEVCFSLGEGKLTLGASLPWREAVGFANMAAYVGWEKAVTKYYPNGARLETAPNGFRVLT